MPSISKRAAVVTCEVANLLQVAVIGKDGM